MSNLLELGYLSDLGDSHASGSRIYRILWHSNGNLVMHFHKTVNIPCFYETELWEGPGVGHPTSKKRMFVLMFLN